MSEVRQTVRPTIYKTCSKYVWRSQQKAILCLGTFHIWGINTLEIEKRLDVCVTAQYTFSKPLGNAYIPFCMQSLVSDVFHVILSQRRTLERSDCIYRLQRDWILCHPMQYFCLTETFAKRCEQTIEYFICSEFLASKWKQMILLTFLFHTLTKDLLVMMYGNLPWIPILLNPIFLCTDNIRRFGYSGTFKDQKL